MHSTGVRHENGLICAHSLCHHIGEPYVYFSYGTVFSSLESLDGSLQTKNKSTLCYGESVSDGFEV